MNEYKAAHLCGGILFALILETRKQRKSRRDRNNSGTDGLSVVDVYCGLVYVVTGDDMTGNHGDSLKKVASQYRSCQSSFGSYVPFTNETQRNVFLRQVTDNKALVYNRVLEFKNRFLSDDKCEWLVRAVIDLMNKDNAVDCNTEIDIDDRKKVKVSGLKSADQINFTVFLTSVLSYVIGHCPDCESGRRTFVEWFTRENNRQEWRFISDIGNSVRHINIIHTIPDKYLIQTKPNFDEKLLDENDLKQNNSSKKNSIEISHFANDEVFDNDLKQLKRRFFNDKSFTALGAAVVIGNWDESNKSDITLIESLSGKSYIDFTEELKMESEFRYSHHEGIYNAESVLAFRKNLVIDMHKAHLEKIFDEFANMMKRATAYNRPSNELLEAVYDFMAFAGVYIGKNDRVKRNDYRNILYEFLTGMFSYNQETIKLIIPGLEMLVEADSRMVLGVVSDYVANENSSVNRLLTVEKRSDILDPLSKALRKATAIPEAFSKAMALLFNLSEYNSLFLDNAVYVLLPRYPQTAVGIEIKKGTIKSFFRKDSNQAWKILARLLPGRTEETYFRLEFKYLPVNAKNLTKNEYEAEISTYIMIACDHLSNNSEQIIDIIESIPFVSDADAGIIENKILSLGKDIDGKEKICKALQSLVDADYEYPKDRKKILKNLLRFYSICEGYGETLNFFSYKKILSRTKADNKASVDVVSAIFQSSGIKALVKLAEAVEDKVSFVKIVYQSVEIETYYSLSDAMNHGENKAIYSLLLNKMTDSDLITYQKRFEGTARIEILTSHALSDGIVSYVKCLSPELEQEYWEKVSFNGCNTLTNDNYDYVVEQTINQKNYETAVQMVWMKTREGVHNTEQIYHVLECIEFPNDNIGGNGQNHVKFVIQKLIAELQNREEKHIDRLIRIERKYIRILINHEFLGPKHLYYKMANDPEYTYSILVENQKNLSEDRYDSSMMQLLYHFDICPGGQSDGRVDFQKMNAWYEFAEIIDDENLRRQMLALFGKTMFYLPEKPEGFFMDERVAELLENVADDYVLRAYESQAINSKGCIDRTPGSHKLEDSIRNYNNKAIACEREGYIRIAEMYRTISDLWSEFLEME